MANRNKRNHISYRKPNPNHTAVSGDSGLVNVQARESSSFEGHRKHMLREFKRGRMVIVNKSNKIASAVIQELSDAGLVTIRQSDSSFIVTWTWGKRSWSRLSKGSNKRTKGSHAG